jgi:beta-N-acetylhexosaminidase
MLRSLLFAILVSLVWTASFASDKRESQWPSNSIHLDRKGERWAQKTLRKLSLEEKVGQLFMVWVRAGFLNVDSPDYLELRDTIRNYHVGGLTMTVPYDAPFLTRSEPYEAATLLNRLQKDSKLHCS